MTEQQCKLVSGGYQEWPHDYNLLRESYAGQAERGWNDLSQHYYCTIVNQTIIEISNS